MEVSVYIRKEIYGGVKRSLAGKIYTRYFLASTNAVYLIRKMQFSKNPLCRAYSRRTLERRYGIFVGSGSLIGLGLKLPHPNGIVIGNAVVVGGDCSIYQQVTLGSRRVGDSKLGKQPHVGDGSVLFAGAKVIGDIELGEGTVVGANSVLTKSTPSYSTWAGIPAKQVA